MIVPYLIFFVFLKIFSIHDLRLNVAKDDAEFNKKKLESGPKSSYGYGGKFGVQQDRMDKVSSSYL